MSANIILRERRSFEDKEILFLCNNKSFYNDQGILFVVDGTSKVDLHLISGNTNSCIYPFAVGLTSSYFFVGNTKYFKKENELFHLKLCSKSVGIDENILFIKSRSVTSTWPYTAEHSGSSCVFPTLGWHAEEIYNDVAIRWMSRQGRILVMPSKGRVRGLLEIIVINSLSPLENTSIICLVDGCECEFFLGGVENWRSIFIPCDVFSEKTIIEFDLNWQLSSISSNVDDPRELSILVSGIDFSCDLNEQEALTIDEQRILFSRGFASLEGPYVEFGLLDQFRWMLGTQSKVFVYGYSGLCTVSIAVRSYTPDQVLSIYIDNIFVGDFKLKCDLKETNYIDFCKHLSTEGNIISFKLNKISSKTNDPRRLGILFENVSVISAYSKDEVEAFI